LKGCFYESRVTLHESRFFTNTNHAPRTRLTARQARSLFAPLDPRFSSLLLSTLGPGPSTPFCSHKAPGTKHDAPGFSRPRCPVSRLSSQSTKHHARRTPAQSTPALPARSTTNQAQSTAAPNWGSWLGLKIQFQSLTLHFFFTLWPPSTVAIEKRTTKSPGLNLSGASGPQGVQKIIGCGVVSKYFYFMTLGNEN